MSVSVDPHRLNKLNSLNPSANDEVVVENPLV